MDRVINRGSRYLLRASTLLESESQPTMDSFIDWGSSFLHNLQHALDPVINWFASLIRSLATNINGDLLLRIAYAVGIAVAAIVVVWLLWTVISAVVVLLWNVISAVVSLLWNMISAVVLWLWNVIKGIFRCCCKIAGKMMKAPGRNISIPRNVFERNPASYFRNLRIDQRNGLV